MESTNRIYQFLNKVRQNRTRVLVLNGAYLLGAVLTAGILIALVLAYTLPGFSRYFPWFLAAWSLPLCWILFRYFIGGALKRFPLESAALLVEERSGGLQNCLINSIQLHPLLDEKPGNRKGISPQFVQELLDRTSGLLDNLKPDNLFPKKELFRNRNILVACLTVLATLFLFWPNLFTEGLRNLQVPPAEAKVNPAGDPAGGSAAIGTGQNIGLKQLKLVFNYPAYTRLKQVTLEKSDGKIQVLPGTEVTLEAAFDSPVKSGELVLHGRDYLSMTSKENNRLEGRFFAKENGYYQFRLAPTAGEKILLDTRYPIQIAKDQAPSILLLLANPKPVYHPTDKVKMFYEGHDDYGISQVDLVVEAGGKVHRQTIKNVKTVDTELKDSFTWELARMKFEPGEEVRYYLEIHDNDNILGPNTGQSEMFSFEIFNEFKKREDLLALQEELLEKMIQLLADTLLLDPKPLTGSTNGLDSLKRSMGDHTDQLIEIIRIAQTIMEQARTISSFPQNYKTLLKNMAASFNKIREDHLHVLSQLREAIGKATPVGLNFPPIETVNQTLVSSLEQDILLLVKIINRERMDQVMDLNDDMTSLAEQLKKEFEKARDQKAEFNSSQFKKALEKIKETLQKIMEQLARQTQGLSDEFLNPSAMENLDMSNFKASLEKLTDLMEKGQMQEALNELENVMKDLKSLSNQFEQMMAEQENLMDLKTVKQLEENLAKVEHLEREEKKLLEKTAKMNKELRSKQSQRFEDRLKNFFASLRKDVNEIQERLRESGTFLEENAQMKLLESLMDRESKLKQEISELNQKTIDSLKDQALQENFSSLNSAREKLSETNSQIQDLHLKMFHGFKTFLPQLKDQYDRLEEFTELQDLYEFDALFKNTYPEIYRWDNQFRTSRDVRPDLRDHMTNELKEISRLNSEISKKLGSMSRDLRADYRALITEADKKNLDSMAQKQNNLKEETHDLADSFKQIQKENPMVPSILDLKARGAAKHMDHSGKNLSGQNVPESIESENRALRELAELKDMLQQMRDGDGNSSPQQQRKMAQLGTGRARDSSSGGGSIRMQRERVTLPTEDQYKVPQQFREEILEAMKHQAPRQYEKMVSQYYKELVK